MNNLSLLHSININEYITFISVPCKLRVIESKCILVQNLIVHTKSQMQLKLPILLPYKSHTHTHTHLFIPTRNCRFCNHQWYSNMSQILMLFIFEHSHPFHVFCTACRERMSAVKRFALDCHKSLSLSFVQTQTLRSGFLAIP